MSKWDDKVTAALRSRCQDCRLHTDNGSLCRNTEVLHWPPEFEHACVLFEPKDVWMTTYTGKKFYPHNPRMEDIDILDIAHSLSLTCRYRGHCKNFYSVAEHCCRLSSMVKPELELAALLHDSAEAYLCDLNSSLKHALPQFGEMEERILSTIFKKFGVEISLIHKFQKEEAILLSTEGRDLMENTYDWVLSEEPLSERIRPHSSSQMESLFLLRFLALTPNR